MAIKIPAPPHRVNRLSGFLSKKMSGLPWSPNERSRLDSPSSVRPVRGCSPCGTPAPMAYPGQRSNIPPLLVQPRPGRPGIRIQSVVRGLADDPGDLTRVGQPHQQRRHRVAQSVHIPLEHRRPLNPALNHPGLGQVVALENLTLKTNFQRPFNLEPCVNDPRRYSILTVAFRVWRSSCFFERFDPCGHLGYMALVPWTLGRDRTIAIA